MSWVVHLLVLLLVAGATATSDQTASEENNASPHASMQQAIVVHFQFGSGAGSDPIFHGNENYEPASGSGHPHFMSRKETSTSRASRNVVVTVRKLQDIQFNGVFGKLNEAYGSLANLFIQIDIPPFYVV